MIQSIGGASAASSDYLRTLLGRLDTDQDDQVSKSEFTSAMPDEASASAAADLFDTLDSESAGALSLDDLESAFQQLSSEMASSLIGEQAEDSGRPAGGPPPGGPPPGGPPPGAVSEEEEEEEDALSAMFSDLDTDGDGTVSQAEFLAARPKEVSEEEAADLYSELAGEDAEGMTEEQFVAAMKEVRPEPPPAPSRRGDASDAVPDADAAMAAYDGDGDGAIASDEATATLSEGEAATGSSQAAMLLGDLLKAIGAYQRFQTPERVQAQSLLSVDA